MKTSTEKLAQIADQKLAESLRKPNSYDAWIDYQRAAKKLARAMGK